MTMSEPKDLGNDEAETKEGPNVSESTGTPLTAHERYMRTVSLQRVRHAANSIEDAITDRDRAMQLAREAGVDEVTIQQAAGIL